MLIKVFIDESVPFANRRSVHGVWIVSEALPLNHPQQLSALATSLRLPVAPASLDGIFLTSGTAKLQASKTPAENQLFAGALVNFSTAAPSPRMVRRQTYMPMSPRGGVGEDDDPTPLPTPRQTSDAAPAPATGKSSPGTLSPRGPAAVQATTTAGTDAAADDEAGGPPKCSDGEDDEYYVAMECGWFPFVAKYSREQDMQRAFIADPNAEPQLTDKEPRYVEMCQPCTNLVCATTPFAVQVDRHTKPMLLDADVVSGWLEKLGGGTLARWQKRYFTVTEKAMDWYDTERKPDSISDEKIKPRGSRLLSNGTEFLVTEIIDAPDPTKYPKCRDPNFYHFGLVCKDPATTVFYRASTAADRNKFVSHFRQLKARAEQHTATRDPVQWKKWSDAFLTNVANMGDLSQNCEEQSVLLEREIADLEHALEEQEGPVRRSHQEKLTLQNRITNELDNQFRHWELAAADAVKRQAATQSQLLADTERMGLERALANDSLRTAEVMRQRGESKLKELEGSVAQLDSDIARHDSAVAAIFRSWRRFEEHHTDLSKDPMGRAVSAALRGSSQRSMTASDAGSDSGGRGGPLGRYGALDPALYAASSSSTTAASPSTALGNHNKDGPPHPAGGRGGCSPVPLAAPSDADGGPYHRVGLSPPSSAVVLAALSPFPQAKGGKCFSFSPSGGR